MDIKWPDYFAFMLFDFFEHHAKDAEWVHKFKPWLIRLRDVLNALQLD